MLFRPCESPKVVIPSEGKHKVDNRAYRHGRDFIIPGRHYTEMSDWTPPENCWKECLYTEVSNAQNKFIKLTFILIKVRGIGEMEDSYLIFTLVSIFLKIELNEK